MNNINYEQQISRSGKIKNPNHETNALENDDD